MILSLFVLYQVRNVNNLTQEECMTECDSSLLDVSSVSYFIERHIFDTVMTPNKDQPHFSRNWIKKLIVQTEIRDFSRFPYLRFPKEKEGFLCPLVS